MREFIIFFDQNPPVAFSCITKTSFFLRGTSEMDTIHKFSRLYPTDCQSVGYLPRKSEIAGIVVN